MGAGVPMDVFSNAAIERGPTRGMGRLPAVDVLRGLAVVAMVIYHTSWDLSELRLIETDIVASPGWRIFARAIASSFLVLVGTGLVLAHRDGVRRRPFVRRLAVVAGAALAVTVATVFVFPDSYIFFGILHNVAVSSLVALPFVGAPIPLTVAAALVVLTAPLWPVPALFDAPVLAFLGLGTRIPLTNDWVPIFPWSGFVLLGVAAMRLAGPMLLRRPRASPMPNPLGRPVAWLGRHSLIIYLAHQPLIFGALAGFVQVFGPNPAAVAAPFLRNCAASCRAADQPEAICRATCACTVAELKGAALWDAVVATKVTPDEAAESARLARICYGRARNADDAEPHPP